MILRWRCTGSPSACSPYTSRVHDEGVGMTNTQAWLIVIGVLVIAIVTLVQALR